METSNPGFFNSPQFSKLLSNSLKVGIIITFLGATFKQLHYPGADILLITGLQCLSIYFLFCALPTDASQSKKENSFNKVFSVTMSVLVIGLMFKWMHWPGADFLLTLSFMSLAIYNTLKALSSKGMSSKENMLHTVFFMAFTVFSISMLFRVQHWPGVQYMIGCTYLALLVIVFIQVRSLRLHRTWLVNISSPIGFTALILFILIALVRLDSSVPRMVVERELIDYQMMDLRMENELKLAEGMCADSIKNKHADIDVVTQGFITEIDQLKKVILHLHFDQAKVIFTKSDNPLLPQKIALRDLVDLEQFSGSNVLFQRHNAIVSLIRNYKGALKSICEKSNNPRLVAMNLDGFITEFPLEFSNLPIPDELYFDCSMNISLLNELSTLQYEALKTRTLILSNLK